MGATHRLPTFAGAMTGISNQKWREVGWRPTPKLEHPRSVRARVKWIQGLRVGSRFEVILDRMPLGTDVQTVPNLSTILK